MEENDVGQTRQVVVPPMRAVQLVPEFFGLSDLGRRRSQNEDNFVIAEMSRALRIRSSSRPQPETLLGGGIGHLFIVADGVGGHRGGEEASALALMTIEQFLLNTLGWVLRLHGDGVLAEFQEALRTADQMVVDESLRRPDLEGMGTTLTMAYCTGSTAYLAHVGDSRCYLFRGGRLERLTRDHTLVDQMVRKGVLSPDEAARHEMRNVITNAVGGNGRGVRPEVHKHELLPEDVLVLCSDGLSDMLTDDQIGAVLREQTSVEGVCRKLVDEANAHGGQDNITVIAARMKAQ